MRSNAELLAMGGVAAAAGLLVWYWVRGSQKHTPAAAEVAPSQMAMSRELTHLRQSMAMDSAELDDTVFLWCGARLKERNDSEEVVDEKRTILKLLKQSSSSTAFIQRMTSNGVLDGCFAVCETLPSVAPDAAFVLANCASNPISHRYFFSGRFRLEPIVQHDSKSALQIMMNLTHDSKFSCQQCRDKLNLMALLDKLQQSDAKTVDQIRHNLKVNGQ